jgi:ABC-2 type transport system permease protein
MKVLAAYAVNQWTRMRREPITLGWTFIFPVLLLLIFGGLHTPTSDTSYAGFLTMGLIGLNTVSIGIFSLGVMLVQARNLGVLQRLALTPQPAWKFVGGHILAAGGTIMVSTLLLLTVGALVFGVPLPRRVGEWSAVLSLGSLTFLTMGYALAASIHDVRLAQVVGNAVFLLMMGLGGVWVPLTSLPTLVQRVGWLSPLGPFLEVLRGVGGLGQPLSIHLSSLTLLAAWSITATVIAVRQFRQRLA